MGQFALPFSFFAHIIKLYSTLVLTGDRERNNCTFLTQQAVACIKVGISHLDSVAPVSLLCCCASDSKCSVSLPLQIPDKLPLKERQPNICTLAASSNESAAWSVMCTSKARICKCLIRTHSRVPRRLTPGPITGVSVCQMLSRSHLSTRCKCGKDQQWFVREHNKPADQAFEIRPSRCGNKIKLEKQQSMKRLSPNFQDADVIVLAVALFQLAAVPWTKASPPHVFLFKPRFSFMDVGCSWLELFSTVWDDTEHLLFMYRSQIQRKDLPLFSRPAKSRTLKGRTGLRWFSTRIFSFHSFVPFIGCFSVSQTCQESGSADYLVESTEDKHLLTGCWIIIFLHGPPDIDLSALFSCSLILLLLWKTAGLCLGRWTGVGCRSLGKKSTLP